MEELQRCDAFLKLADSKYASFEDFKKHLNLTNIYLSHRYEISINTWKKIMENPEILFEMYPNETHYKE